MKYFITALLFTMATAPGWAHPSLMTLQIDTGSGIYEIDSEDGLRYSADGGTSWESRNKGLPEKVVYPFDKTEYRPILDISVDPTAPGRVAVVTDSDLLYSPDGGLTWETIQTASPVSRVEVFTAVEIVPGSTDTIYLGSSFNGLYVSRDWGGTWESIDDPLAAIYLGAGFNEEIRALAVSAADTDTLYLAAGFGAGVYRSTDGGESFSPFEVPGDGEIIDMYVRLPDASDKTREELVVVRENRTFVLSGGSWNETANLYDTPVVDTPDRRAEGRTGIYVNSAYAGGDRLAAHLELIRENGMNSMVVDMKDDAGYLTYDTGLERHKSYGAVRERFKLDELISRAHEQDVYVIGRIVVFQDPRLYRYDSGRYAVWNAGTEKPWANLIPVRDADGNLLRNEQREFWVDAFSEEVWDYNIEIALELEARGIDEVQFDYIRFASDGDTKSITYRYARDGMTKSDALESFLKKADSSLDIPIGVDVFGFNGWYLMGNWIGQNIAAMAPWVDVISPMYYPSHYPRAFLGEMNYLPRAKAIYESGSERAAAIVEGMAYIRPYVQAFLIGGERNYEEDTYEAYLHRQLDGVLDSRASGFTLWNASNNYYMIVNPLTSYTSEYDADDRLR